MQNSRNPRHPLRTLLAGPRHGHAIAKYIQRTSEDLLQGETGSLYPALHPGGESGVLGTSTSSGWIVGQPEAIHFECRGSGWVAFCSASQLRWAFSGTDPIGPLRELTFDQTTFDGDAYFTLKTRPAQTKDLQYSGQDRMVFSREAGALEDRHF
jgi:hypothetical protein